MAVKIFDVEIYRDGSSLEFRIEKNGVVRHAWLDTPLRQERRQLKTDGAAVPPRSEQAKELVSDVELWFESLPAEVRALASEAAKHNGAFFNPTAEMRVQLT